MTNPTYFISDLHLPAAPSPLREIFLKFITGPARDAQALYILGDLFEYWVGDDVGISIYRAEVDALSGLTCQGVPVYFQHGNRDFLVGREFASKSGIQLLPDFHQLELGGERTLLSHGDLFCTGDVGYQRWRTFAHNPLAQGIYLRLPHGLRERIAGGVRARSDSGKSYKAADIMDVSDQTVHETFIKTGVARIIHGHTHRPADHAYSIAGKARTRIVLSDWRSGDPRSCEALCVDGLGFRRVTLTS